MNDVAHSLLYGLTKEKDAAKIKTSLGLKKVPDTSVLSSKPAVSSSTDEHATTAPPGAPDQGDSNPSLKKSQVDFFRKPGFESTKGTNPFPEIKYENIIEMYDRGEFAPADVEVLNRQIQHVVNLARGLNPEGYTEEQWGVAAGAYVSLRQLAERKEAEER